MSKKSEFLRRLDERMAFSRNPEDVEDITDVLSMGLDPINVIPGAAGVGAGLLQGAGEFRRKKK